MSDNNMGNMDQLLAAVPGGIAKLVLDDDLTILYATDTFYSLIRNATDKSNTKFAPALLRVVYSADIIYVTQQIAAQRRRRDNTVSINFRTLQPNGSFRWVMVNGTRSEEVYPSGGKVLPVYSCIAMDITDHMIKYKKLEQEFEYHRTISELSKELYFVYEIATDNLNFTPLFREVFNKESEIKGFSKRLEETKVVFPDELPAVIKIFKSMMSGKKQVRFELRLFTREGVPTWYICYASIIFDENKNPFRVIGKLATTNPLRRELEPVVLQPQLDELMKVCTKECAERLIKESLSKQVQESISALMLLEVRNYKSINEVMKLSNGQDILTAVAEHLKTKIRSTDIIGRFGVSEFIVFIKDIKIERNAYEKAEQLCKEIDTQYSFGHIRNKLSVSIGLAFTKGEQLDYPTLLINARTALVMAKKENTSAFEVFYSAQSNS